MFPFLCLSSLQLCRFKRRALSIFFEKKLKQQLWCWPTEHAMDLRNHSTYSLKPKVADRMMMWMLTWIVDVFFGVCVFVVIRAPAIVNAGCFWGTDRVTCWFWFRVALYDEVHTMESSDFLNIFLPVKAKDHKVLIVTTKSANRD